MYLIPFTTSIEIFFKHNDYFNSVKKNIKNQSDFSFLCTMHIYLKYLNKIDVNSEIGINLLPQIYLSTVYLFQII